MKGREFVVAFGLLAAVFGVRAQGAILSGRVTDGANGVFDANINVFDSGNGSQIATSADHTDANGFFAFVVPTGRFDLHVIPPLASRLVPTEVLRVQVNADTNIGTVVVQSGFIVSGTVLDSGGFPLAACDIDVILSIDGTTLFTPGDNTDATGFVDVVIPPGTYDIAIDPDPTTFLVAQVLPGIVVSSDTSFGTVQLQDGFAVSGTVRGPSNVAVVGADIDARDTFTGASVRLLLDNTDTLGNFSVIVPPGFFDISVQPTVASRRVPVRVLDVDTHADVNIGIVNVVAGVQVSGAVTASGSPQALIDIDAYSSTDDSVPIQGDRTDANGLYASIVPSGTDDLSVDVPSALGFKHILMENVSITSDRTQNFALQTTPVTADILPQDIGTTRGSFVHYSLNLRNNTGSPRTVNYTVVAKAFGGQVTRTLVPSTQRTLAAGATPLGPFQAHVPGDLRPRFTRVPVRVFVTVTDASTSAVLDSDFYEFRVY
jgi:hypothetical protein